jgi:hypothetical protein
MINGVAVVSSGKAVRLDAGVILAKAHEFQKSIASSLSR